MTPEGGNATGIIDTHVHSWDTSAVYLPWLDEHPDLPRQPQLPDSASRRQANVTGMILVEAGAAGSDAPSERDWMLRLAGDRDTSVLGIVSPSELDDDSLTSVVLDPVRGVRVNVRGLDQDAATSAIEHALVRAAARAWAVDVLCSLNELPSAASAALRSPSQSIVIDHMGSPPLIFQWRDPKMHQWRHGMQELANIPNVVVKISGQRMGGAASDAVRWVVDEFGTGRCMLGSDWPVSETRQYGRWFAQVAQALGGLDERLRQGTARRIYRLHG